MKKIKKKEINDFILLDVITEQLCDYASKIMVERETLNDKLNSIINEIHHKLKNNKEVINKQKAIYRENNKEKIAASYEKNKEKYAVTRRIKYKENTVHYKEYGRKWRVGI